MRAKPERSVLRHTVNTGFCSSTRNYVPIHHRHRSVSQSAVHVPFGLSQYPQAISAGVTNSVLQSEVNYLFRPYNAIPTAGSALASTQCFYFCGLPYIRISRPFIPAVECNFPHGFGIKAVVVGVSDDAAWIKWRIHDAFAVFNAVDFEICTKVQSTSGERIVPVRSDGRMPNANELRQQNTGMFYVYPLQ